MGKVIAERRPFDSVLAIACSGRKQQAGKANALYHAGPTRQGLEMLGHICHHYCFAIAGTSYQQGRICRCAQLYCQHIGSLELGLRVTQLLSFVMRYRAA